MDYKHILTDICSSSSSNLHQFQCNSTGNGFDACVRVKTPSDLHEENSAWCDRWIAEFSTKTCTNWIVRYTYPSAKRYIYRKIFKCQHNSFDKVKDRKRNDFRMRDKECNATIDIVFKKINRNTIKNDELLKSGFNVCIKVSKYYNLVVINTLNKYTPKLSCQKRANFSMFCLKYVNNVDVSDKFLIALRRPLKNLSEEAKLFTVKLKRFWQLCSRKINSGQG